MKELIAKARGYLSNYQRSLLLIFSIICLVINAFVYLIYRQNQEMNDAKWWVSHTYEVMEGTQAVFSKLQEIEIRYRGYLLTREKGFSEAFPEDSKELLEQLQKLKQLTADNPNHQARLAALGTLIDQQLALLQEQMKTDQFLTGEELEDPMEISRKNLLSIKEINKEIIKEERNLLDARTIAEEKTRKNYFLVLFASSAGSVLILFIANGLILYISTKRSEVEKNLTLAEKDLANTSERLKLALKATADGLYDWQIGSDEIYFSPRYKEILGYTDDEMKNTLAEFNLRVHPDDAAGFWDYTNGYLNKEFLEYRIFFRMLHKDGGWRWIMARAIALYDSSGKAYRLIGTHTDITDMKNLEEKLKASNKELEGFTYIASHDLRAPLVNLKGFAVEMKRSINNIGPIIDHMVPMLEAEERKTLEDVFFKEIPEALEFISSSVQRMDKLTNSILELSRIGRRELKIEKIDMNKLIRNCVNSSQYQIATKGVEVTIGELPEISGDYTELERVFANIIDNSVKYLDPARPGKIRIDGRKGASETLFWISDNGRGIAREDFYKIFEIFRRAGPQNVPGEGMGMAFVKAILRRHGGDIWFDSELGAGTTFYVTIANYLNNKINFESLTEEKIYGQ